MLRRESIALEHLDRMTDSTGLIQHAIYGIPRRESGYTTDDNARALRLCTRLWRRRPSRRLLARVTRYLSFLEYARKPGGGFHNFLSYQRTFFDAEETADCQGQASRALAEIMASTLPDDYRMLAGELLDAVLPTLADLRSLRAQAYVILSAGCLWSAHGRCCCERLERVAWSAAQHLAECYRRSSRLDWHWFESRLTYANAVLPHALFVAARHWPNESFLEIAEASYQFLDRETTVAGQFWPVGNAGWYPHGEAKAQYDQQPVEAVVMAEAALAASGDMNDNKYLATFRRAYLWFHGQNSQQMPLVDPERGACYDGLLPLGVNRNQGAESTLAFLMTELLHVENESLVAMNCLQVRPG